MIPEAIYALAFEDFLFICFVTGSLDSRLGYWGAAVYAPSLFLPAQ